MLYADAVFEGGGVKGVGLVGGLAAGEQAGYRWQHVAGTSAGAIVAALVAAGYSAEELHDITVRLKYRRFLDQRWLARVPVAGAPLHLVWYNGLYVGDQFLQWMRGLLHERGVRTFGDLRDPNPPPGDLPEPLRSRLAYRLNVVATDLTREKLLVLPCDAEEYGIAPDDLEVALAVRMSMSIPLFFAPVRVRHSKGNKVPQECFIVDGGVLSNFPVWLFDVPGQPRWPTFGFKLVEPQYGRPNRIVGPVSLIKAMFSTMLEAHDQRYIKDHDFVRTIPIPTLGVRTTDFGLTADRAEALFQAGKRSAEQFFARWDFSSYVNRFRAGPSPR